MSVFGARGNTSRVKLSRAVSPGLAAIEVARELGPDRVVVRLRCDSGLQFLATDVDRRD